MVGYPQDVFGVFSYYQLVTIFLNMVCLTVALFVKKNQSKLTHIKFNPIYPLILCGDDKSVEGEG